MNRHATEADTALRRLSAAYMGYGALFLLLLIGFAFAISVAEENQPLRESLSAVFG